MSGDKSCQDSQPIYYLLNPSLMPLANANRLSFPPSLPPSLSPSLQAALRLLQALGRNLLALRRREKEMGRLLGSTVWTQLFR